MVVIRVLSVQECLVCLKLCLNISYANIGLEKFLMFHVVYAEKLYFLDTLKSMRKHTQKLNSINVTSAQLPLEREVGWPSTGRYTQASKAITVRAVEKVFLHGKNLNSIGESIPERNLMRVLCVITGVPSDQTSGSIWRCMKKSVNVNIRKTWMTEKNVVITLILEQCGFTIQQCDKRMKMEWQTV